VERGGERRRGEEGRSVEVAYLEEITTQHKLETPKG
jgi:hypothetical protein